MAPQITIDQIEKVSYCLSVDGVLINLGTLGQRQLALHSEYVHDAANDNSSGEIMGGNPYTCTAS